MIESSSAVQVVTVDHLMVRTMELEGLLCFHCPWLEPVPQHDPAECRVRARDLLPVVDDERSGILAAVKQARIVGYAVFGRPELFPNLDRLPFEIDEEALLIGALYATAEAQEANVDVDLLIAVMGFAQANGFEKVQALCRAEPGDEPEGRAEVFSASGFEVGEEQDGLCLAEITVQAWDKGGEETEETGLGFLKG